MDGRPGGRHLCGELLMTVMQVLSFHRSPAPRAHERVRVLTVVEGVVALVALIAFVGGLAGAITYALVWLIKSRVG